MGYDRNLPFQKGTTLYAGVVPASPDYSIVGREFEMDDPVTGRTMTLRAVRNETGQAILGRQPVQLNAAGTSITGYANRPDQSWVVTDDSSRFPATGVKDDDVCYVHVRGPAIAKTASSALLAIVVGDKIIGATGANSTAPNGVNKIGALASATDAATINDGVQGRALTAATANQTETAILLAMDSRLV